MIVKRLLRPERVRRVPDHLLRTVPANATLWCEAGGHFLTSALYAFSTSRTYPPHCEAVGGSRFRPPPSYSEVPLPRPSA